jgi:hypothetical protein
VIAASPARIAARVLKGNASLAELIFDGNPTDLGRSRNE